MFSTKLGVERAEILKLLENMKHIPESQHPYHCLFSPYKHTRLGLKRAPAFGLVAIASTSMDLKEQLESMRDRNTGLDKEQLEASFMCAEGLRRTQAKRLVKKPLTVDEADLDEDQKVTRMNSRRAIMRREAHVDEMAKMYCESDENTRNVIKEQNQDCKDEIERRAALLVPEDRTRSHDLRAGLSMLLDQEEQRHINNLREKNIAAFNSAMNTRTNNSHFNPRNTRRSSTASSTSTSNAAYNQQEADNAISTSQDQAAEPEPEHSESTPAASESVETLIAFLGL